VSQKTAPFHFCTNFVRPASILMIFDTHVPQWTSYRKHISCSLQSQKQRTSLSLKSTMHHGTSTCACVHSRRNTPDFIIAPNLWLLNISDFSPVDYRLLAMLLEWVCQYLVRHVDKLRQRLIDRQTVIDQAINRWWCRLRALQTWTFWTFDIVQCFTIALHCWSICFHTLCDVSFKCWRR